VNRPIKIREVEILEIRLWVEDVHMQDRPDFILWLEMDIRIAAQKLSLKIPIPIEAEVGGIANALEDLDAFAERGHYPLHLPMLIIAKEGFDERVSEMKRISAYFKMKQIPVRLLKY